MEPVFKYPNFNEALETLKSRKDNVNVEHVPLLDKWIEQVEKINKQMRQLERMETFSHALKERDDTNE
jgi:hypothetical protein